MADIARTSIRWLRKRHPVNSIDATGGSRASLEVGVRVTNAGDTDWTASPPWQVRGHLIAGGIYYQDPLVKGAILPDPVPAGGTVDAVIEFLSDPFTPGLTPAALFDPNTLVVVDVVHEEVAWLGEADGGSPAQRYVREALRDVLGGESFDTDVARTGGLIDWPRGDVAVPTSGPALDVIFASVPDGATHYLVGLTAVASGASAQRLAFRLTRPGESEQELENWIVAPDAPWPPYKFDPHRRLDQGDQFRITVAPNPDGGTVSLSLERIVLPWVEEF